MWDIDVRGILLHPTEAKAWLTPGPQAYRLPGFTFTHPEDPFLPNQLEGAWFPGLQNVYGCLLYVMGHVAEWKDSKSRRARVVCVLGIREGCPTRGEWVDIGAVSSGSFAVSEHGGLVRRTLSGLAEGSDEPALQKPWRRRGWFAQAADWIERELPRLGYGPVTEIEQRRSAILRVHTEQEVFYFKAAEDPWNTREPVVADVLGTRYPCLIPRPVSIDASRHWMLTAEFGATLEDPERDEEMLVQVARAYGQMQLDSAAWIYDLAGTVSLDFDLNRLPSAMEEYARDSPVMEMLEPEEVSALQRHLPILHDCVQQLSDSPIPQTIVHGDLGPYNIAQRNGKPLIFDWGTAGISFPFFDIVELLHRVRLNPPSGDSQSQALRQRNLGEVRSRIRTAYLSVWTACAPLSELEKLWAGAELLGFVSMALHLPFPWFPRRVIRWIEDHV